MNKLRLPHGDYCIFSMKHITEQANNPWCVLFESHSLPGLAFELYKADIVINPKYS